MRITIVNMLYPPTTFGGAEKAASLLAEAFARRGDHVSVISLHTGDDEVVEDWNGVRVYRLPIDNIYWPMDLSKRHNVFAKTIWHIKDAWNTKAAHRIGRILDQEKPEVVHTHTLNGFSVSIWQEAKKRNIRLVHTMHDYYLLCGRSCIYRNGKNCVQRCLDCKALTTISKAWSHKLDAIVSVSEFVLNTHIKQGYFGNVPSSVIYNINIKKKHSGQPQSVTARENDGQLVFGFIGRLCPEKGIEILLEATKHLTRADWTLKIAGVGAEDYTSDLRNRYTDPRIEWLGFIDSQSFYESIDVTIVPSVSQDPLPYTVIESLMAGKSLILSDSGGLPELSRLAKTVMIYPAADAGALAEIMQNALSDTPYWQSGGFADPNAASIFTEDTVVARYKAVYG